MAVVTMTFDEIKEAVSALEKQEVSDRRDALILKLDKATPIRYRLARSGDRISLTRGDRLFGEEFTLDDLGDLQNVLRMWLDEAEMVTSVVMYPDKVIEVTYMPEYDAVNPEVVLSDEVLTAESRRRQEDAIALQIEEVEQDEEVEDSVYEDLA